MTVIGRTWRVAAFAVMLLFVSGNTECYKPVRRNELPTRIRTVAVPAFQNNALRYKVGSRFTDAVMREIIRRGRGLRVQGEGEREGERERNGEAAWGHGSAGAGGDGCAIGVSR